MRISLLFIFINVLGACSSAGQTKSPTPFPSSASSVKPVVSMEREYGECLGKCPVYKVTLYEDQAVEFVGIKNVHKLGMVKLKARPEAVNRLRGLFANSRFSAMNAEYVRGKNCSTPVLSDADTVIIKWYENSVPKSVRHYQGCMNVEERAGEDTTDLDRLFKVQEAIVQETGIAPLISVD